MRCSSSTPRSACSSMRTGAWSLGRGVRPALGRSASRPRRVGHIPARRCSLHGVHHSFLPTFHPEVPLLAPSWRGGSPGRTPWRPRTPVPLISPNHGLVASHVSFFPALGAVLARLRQPRGLTGQGGVPTRGPTRSVGIRGDALTLVSLRGYGLRARRTATGREEEALPLVSPSTWETRRGPWIHTPGMCRTAPSR